MQTGTMRLRELTVRYSVRKDDEGQAVVVGRDMRNPREAAASLMTMLEDEPSEVFAILCITTKHRVIGYHEVSRGTLDATLVHPRGVQGAAAGKRGGHHPVAQPSQWRPEPQP
jgi:DNA repair protein RadC